jgi:hypothetical protein
LDGREWNYFMQIAFIQSIHPIDILRFAGHVDTDYLDTHIIALLSKICKKWTHGNLVLSDIGNDSVIRLQAGGLKVGQLLLENNLMYKNDVQLAELL